MREAVGPWPAIRVDANGAWTPDQAVAALEELAPLDLELVEQPCATLEELAEVRARVEVTVAADESIAGPDDVHRAAALAACDAVNIKLAAAGGYGPARDALRAAREHHWRPGCPARWTARGVSPPGSSWRRRPTWAWRAGWPRSSCSTPAWPARCPAPSTA